MSNQDLLWNDLLLSCCRSRYGFEDGTDHELVVWSSMTVDIRAIRESGNDMGCESRVCNLFPLDSKLDH